MANRQELVKQLEELLRAFALDDEDDAAVLTGFMVIYSAECINEDSEAIGYVYPSGMGIAQTLGFGELLRDHTRTRVFSTHEDDEE